MTWRLVTEGRNPQSHRREGVETCSVGNDYRQGRALTLLDNINVQEDHWLGGRNVTFYSHTSACVVQNVGNIAHCDESRGEIY